MLSSWYHHKCRLALYGVIPCRKARDVARLRSGQFVLLEYTTAILELTRLILRICKLWVQNVPLGRPTRPDRVEVKLLEAQSRPKPDA